MAKVKTVFFCQECGHESAKWLGKCPSCSAWSSFVEEKINKSTVNQFVGEIKKPIDIHSVNIENANRIDTNIAELNNVLGGGIVDGSLILIGGDPGIGKSTIILQILNNMKNKNVLYLSGEESESQIKIRANRLGVEGAFDVLSETNIDLLDTLSNKYNFIVVDSIQTMYKPDITSAPGSVSQVREITNYLMKLAKIKNIPIIIIGHVTKDGAIAGPRVLEHMVDVVLYFEGDKNSNFRILRSVKNRFGKANEIGIFEMTEKGLMEVLNPSKFMITERDVKVSGSALSCVIEGSKPILLELQSLMSQTNFGMPRRTATGVDYNKVVMLLAVIEKKIGINLGSYDCYVNVTGGLKISEPEVDLAIVAAIISSFKDVQLQMDTVFVGEIGLTGEVRSVSNIEKRINELEKLGYKNVIIPYNNMKNMKSKFNINIMGVKDVKEFYSKFF